MSASSIPSPLQPFTGRAIIDYLLQSKELTMSDIRDHGVTFMFTGLDTSSNTLQWLMALLALHPQCQDRLYDELCNVMGRGSCPAVEDVSTCAYLTNVIKEALRLYGVAAFIGRDAQEDDVLPHSKVIIPKGTYIVVGLIATHRSSETFGEDAELFRPERWEDPALEERTGLGGFIPFGVGKRNCIGKEFAMVEMMILLAVLVRNFKMDFRNGQTFPKAQLDIIYTPHAFKVAMSMRSD